MAADVRPSWWWAALLVLALLACIGVGACKSKGGTQKESVAGEATRLSGAVLNVYFFNIGQGDSALLRAPNGDDILIDAGDRGSSVVAKLQQLGVKRLALAIATHPHADHIGEMHSVLDAFPTAELWDATVENDTKIYEQMLLAIKRNNVRYAQPTAGTTRSFGPVQLEVLHPEAGNPINSNINDGSIVVRVTYGDKRFLFTGDAELPSWAQMFDRHREQLRADVLKAAHHGSSNGTNSGVLVNVRPAFVVVSCALGNSYHHPHPSVVRLLEQSSDKTRFLRTDLFGTIHMTTDGKTIEVKTEKQAAKEQVYMSGDEAAENAGVEVRRSRGGR